MPDNFSDSLNQEGFAAKTPPGLRGQHRRGSNIENQIADCLNVSEAELLRRLKITDYSSAEFLKGETLVCLLKAAHEENLTQFVDPIAEKLAKIVEKIVRDLLKKRGFSDNYVEEAVEQLVFEVITQVLGREKISYDFWEVNFFVSLERLTRGFLRKTGEDAKLTDTFSELSSPENENGQDFENTLRKTEPLTIEQKLDIKDALGRLPNEHRRIFMLYEIENWTQAEIAEVFGVTSRTVRNRLSEIDEYLQEVRAAGGEK